MNCLRTEIYLLSISSASWYLPSCLRASPALTMAIHWPESVRNDLLNNLTALSRSPEIIYRISQPWETPIPNQWPSLSIRAQISKSIYKLWPYTNCDINFCSNLHKIVIKTLILILITIVHSNVHVLKPYYPHLFSASISHSNTRPLHS